jgi:hypothetical protein
MLKLKALTVAEQKRHYDLLAARFKEQLSNSVKGLSIGSYDRALMKYLTQSLETLLVGTPRQIEDLANHIVNWRPDFSAYAASHRKSEDQKDIKHKNTLTIINKCLDYDWFSRQTHGWGAYALVQSYKLRICPYCQANHVNLHVEKVKGARGTSAFRLRPPLDHYLPKSVYPYLAVSLSNLVPSCAQCNSGVKTAGDPRGKGFAHPLDTTIIRVKFSSKGTLRKSINGQLHADDVVLTLQGVDDPNVPDGPSTKHIQEFRLQDRYQWYRHEIKDLLDRDEQHRDLSGKLQSVIPRELYVLGFLQESAEARALGLCLRDIYEEIWS